MSYDQTEAVPFEASAGGGYSAHDDALASGQIGDTLPMHLEPATVLAKLTDGSHIELLCERHPRWQALRLELLQGLAQDCERDSDAAALAWATLDGSSLLHRDGTRAHVERKGDLTSVCALFGCVLIREGKALGFCTMATLLEFGEGIREHLTVSLDEVWLAPQARSRGYAKPLAQAGAAVVRQFLRAIGGVFREAMQAGELSPIAVLRPSTCLEVDIKSESGERFAATLERVLDEVLPRVLPGIVLGPFDFRLSH